ncbi:MAG: PaaI family thioesterase [Pseudomonadota bacterium]
MAKGRDSGLLAGMVDTPIIRTMGIRYLASGPGWLEAEFRPAARYTNHVGYVQGGVLAVYLDNIMGQCCHALFGGEQLLTTTDLSLHFLAPAPHGRLLGRAKVLKKGRRVLFVEGQVLDLQGNPLASAVATMLVLRTPRALAMVPDEGPVPEPEAG